MIPAIIGAAGSILATGVNNGLAKNREQQAREENYRLNEQAANNADARTRALYNDLYSPAAQIQQLKEAGLSPSIYASGGIAGKSGTSGAQGSGAQGIAPNVYGIDPMIASQMAVNMATAEKLKSETRTNNANLPNIHKQGILIDAQVKQTLAEAGYKEAATQMTLINKDLFALQLAIEEWKLSEGVTYEMIESEARTLYNNSLISEEMLKQAEIKSKLDNATFQDNVKYVAMQNAHLFTDILLKESQITLNNTQAESLIESLIIDWYKVNIDALSEQAKIKHMGDQLTIELRKLGIDATTKSNEQTLHVLTSIMQSLTSILTMSMLTKGGLPLRQTNETNTPTQTGQPSLPFN